MNTKKMTAFIVGAMLIATVLVMAVSAAGMDREKYLGMPRMVYEFDAVDDTGIYINDGPTVRIYGEEDAIYPTQSYTEALDFIYPDPVDPFDPGVIGKDSATFNPAYMYGAASVDGDDLLEDDMKVFFRVFYEPGYDHVVDDLMVNNIVDMQRRDITMPEGALVTETTFMLVQNGGYKPITGAADKTLFKLPVNSGNSVDVIPGMDVNAIVDLLYAEGDGLLGAGELTDGAIEVGIEHIGVEPNVPVRFMDHEVEFTGSDGGFAYFDIKYIGNMYEEAPGDITQIAVPLYNQKVYVERYNTGQSATNPAYRWFISVGAVNCADWCTFTVGRHLAAGETFYVDGIRYDMPAIYVTDNDEFKYITLQSPLPKCTDECECDMWIRDGFDLNQVDYSHVSNQWLARLLIDENVWMLPPFNEDDHTMIDDIGLTKTPCTGGVTVTQAGDIYGLVDALEFHYIKEDTEDRFDTSLAERHARKDGVELWNWWSVFTKPDHYVELVLPNDEDGMGHDGYEYLITTSFIAPNSEADNRPADCKDPETHDIIDRAATIANDDDFDSRDTYSGMPRMVFEFDAVQTEDLFVNEDEKIVNLVEKDTTDWSVVPNGNCGTLTYTIDSDGILTYDFVVVDDDTLTGPHELVVIAPELNGHDEWPQTGSIALTGLSGTADISSCLGWIDDGADYNGGVYGAKIWYVPTADFDGTAFTAWNPENILFEEDLIVPTAATVRVYGEENALYPTQSMTGAVDFIYPDAVDPFDPGVIAKDSVTFNPAYIDNGYGIPYREITVDGSNADEKVFMRAFYEPGYYHPIDAKMNDAGSGTDPVDMENGALVVETTYMLLHDNSDSGHSGAPKAGAARDGDGNVITYFMLPTHSNNLFNDGVAGMNRAQVVDLNWASGAGTSQLTDGEIEVQTRPFTLVEGQAINFMDHKIKFVRPTTGMEIKLDISYIGNMQLVEDRLRTDVEVNEDQKCYVDRLNNLHPAPDPDWRFYFEVVSMTYDAANDKYEANLIVGRRLVAGETFYVDGVRYDMPAIYVTDEDKFKYITFQTPLPKCEGEMWYAANEDNQADKSHVTCQWLANLLPRDDVWMLPPFNDPHTMIDDIGILKVSCGDDDRTIYSEAGNILGTVDPLEFYYIAEEEEPRFDSSLAERLNSDGSTEIWNWWSIFTKPYEYTELVLPDQETATMADGNEYLITTSFIAPNCEDEEREELCKSDREVHDIIDRASELVYPVVNECKGDFCGDGDPEPDGDIDAFDFVEFCAAYGSSVGDTNYNSAGDFCGDGDPEPDDDIDAFDFVEFCAVYGTSCP